jgi:glycosyltransferase involved in cell wall biosynthesis
MQEMKRNILILIGSFDQGGSERQAVQLVRLLHESGRFRVHVACQKADGVLRGEVDALGLGEIPEYPLNSFYDRNMLVQLNRFRGFLRERQIEVVQTFDFYTNVFGILGATLARVPVRIAAKRETDGTRTPAQKFTEHRIFGLAHAVVANAEAVRSQLIRDGVPAEKIVTVYNGMDTERVAPESRLSRAAAAELFNLPREPSRRFVSIVANMRHPMKDQPTFLRAARRVRESVPEAAFVLAGEGELVPRIREYATELGLGDDAFFIGRCAEVSELLNLSDVCVLSSKGVEGFSNSITEYMAAARPVVATDIGGAREAIVEGETGYVVAPEDDATMAERIIALLTNPERARAMGKRGRQVVAEKFSCAAQLGRIENLYERLLAGRGAQPNGAELERPEEAHGASR